MISTRSRALAALAAGAILLGSLAGCGGASKEAKKPSTSSVDAFVNSLTNAMQAKKTAKLELELGSAMSATADVDYADSGTRMALKMITGSTTVQVVVDDGVMYLQQQKGGKYLKVDKDDPALGSLLGQVTSLGPKNSVSSLKAGIKKVDDLGTEDVDGEKLTHYALTVDPAKVSALFGAPAGTAGTAKTITYDVYVDSDNLLRRVKMKVSGQTLVMKVSDWGKPVTITVPSASQVISR